MYKYKFVEQDRTTVVVANSRKNAMRIFCDNTGMPLGFAKQHVKCELIGVAKPTCRDAMSWR